MKDEMSEPTVDVPARVEDYWERFDVQVNVWGYSLYGPDLLEFTAVVAEDHPDSILTVTRNGAPCWDRDRAYVDSIESWRDNERQPTWKFALAGLCDLRFYGIEKSA